MGQLANVLRDLGFTIIGDFNSSTTIVQSHFNNKGWGIGIIPGTIGHQVFLTGYNPSTNSFTYYDATKPNNRTGTISNSGIKDLLIK